MTKFPFCQGVVRASGLAQSKSCMIVQQPLGTLVEAAAPPSSAFTAMFCSSKHANHGLPSLWFVQTKSLSRLQLNMVGAPQLEVAQGIGVAFSHHPNQVMVSGSSAAFTGTSLGGSGLTAVFYMSCACRQHLQEGI